MQLANCQPLFAWDALEDSPSLGTIKRFLATIPDAPLLDSLRQARGHGRDDHPVPVLWGVLLLTIVLRHVHFEACLAELRRNDDLRALIGIPRDEEDKVPDGWNVSRFLHVLGQEPHRGTLSASCEQELQVRVAERDGTDHVPVSPQAWIGVRHARRVRRHQLLDPGAVRLLQARQGFVRG